MTARKPAKPARKTPPKKPAGKPVAGRKPAGKGKPAPKPTKPTKRTPAGKKRHAKTAGKPPAAASPPVAVKPRPPKVEALWYVLAVETGMDGRVCKEIRRRKKIESMENVIGRCYSPKMLREVVRVKGGEELARGKEPDFRSALAAGVRKAWELKGITNEWEIDPRRPPTGLRVRCYRAKSLTCGKEGNGFEWAVKSERTMEERKCSIRVRKFPGYVIVRAKLTPAAFHLIDRIKGVMSILPPKPVLGRHPKQEEKEALDNWKPIALETHEAAELLIEQTLVNKAVKERNAVVELKYKVGDSVNVTDGPFAKMSGTVLSIGGTAAEPAVKVEVHILGRAVPVDLKHWQCEQS